MRGTQATVQIDEYAAMRILAKLCCGGVSTSGAMPDDGYEFNPPCQKQGNSASGMMTTSGKSIPGRASVRRITTLEGIGPFDRLRCRPTSEWQTSNGAPVISRVKITHLFAGSKSPAP